MNRLNQSNMPIIYTSILYIAGLLLFMEWLYPVKELTDTAYVGVFMIYTIFCFFISMLQVRWWLSFLLKGFGLLFVLNGVFSEHSFLSMLWYKELLSDLFLNVDAMLARHWFDLTNMFRTLLFLIIIWLMSYLIHYWFVQVKRIMIFSVLTFIYVTLLDTFTVYHADWAILRTFVIAFIALGLANVLKEMQREGIQTYSLRKKPLWILPLITIVLFSTMVGYAAPKFEPQWPDPVPFLKSATNGFGGKGGIGIQKVGYGENDSRLGGSFVQDYNPVFQAYVKNVSYFRIESKDVYTGKGWVNSDGVSYVEQADGAISLETFSPSIEVTESDASIVFSGDTDIPKVLYPYGIRQVDLLNQEAQLLLNEESGEIRTELDNKEISLPGYKIYYDYPSYPIGIMREAKAVEDSELLERYTQLPNSLPDRVYQLATEITANHDSQYDKVRAVERYFSSNGFAYQTTDVAVPGQNEDYVDQFLFETKVGYCDNFSTSMVVLLRAMDIPARWVKGFTSGEKLEDNIDNSDYDLYEVTNANAHSWVEVYFPEVGWVPFEPTQGFNVPNDFAIDTSSNEDDVLEAPDANPQQPEQPEREPEEAVETIATNDDSKESHFEITWVHGAIATAVLLLIAAILYWKRYQLQTYFIERKMIKRGDAASYQDAYHYILKLLKHKGFTKNPDQTLREYARRIDNWYGTDEMGRLTTNYERLIYQQPVVGSGQDELSNLWKNLINRILG
ncbi:DUF4129 domain-containing transglutaminase family protein [Ornithinibacillus xuwenensis]|uniref:Transglutaminase domain-containing protein n=1 Tax=Ornithinibacillus xuwenensis TaxID=3144668 RepID=A0ABU9XK95_9BACI